MPSLVSALTDVRGPGSGRQQPRKLRVLVAANRADVEVQPEQAGRPVIYLQKRIRKEDRARRLAAKDGVTEGPICVFSTQETCLSFKIAYGKGRPRLRRSYPRCLVLYFYYLDPDFGLLHIRLPTWFPFTLQVYVNGHEYVGANGGQHVIHTGGEYASYLQLPVKAA